MMANRAAQPKHRTRTLPGMRFVAAGRRQNQRLWLPTLRALELEEPDPIAQPLTFSVADPAPPAAIPTARRAGSGMSTLARPACRSIDRAHQTDFDASWFRGDTIHRPERLYRTGIPHVSMAGVAQANGSTRHGNTMHPVRHASPRNPRVNAASGSPLASPTHRRVFRQPLGPGKGATGQSLHPTFSKIRTRCLPWLTADPKTSSRDSALHGPSPALASVRRGPGCSSHRSSQWSQPLTPTEPTGRIDLQACDDSISAP
jgi:hypothetical protein